MVEMGLYAVVAPLVLLLVSSVWQYPPILEEVAKWGILRLTADAVQLTVKQGVMVGLLFGLSEAVLYSLNGWQGGQWAMLGMRLLLTVPMHTLTGAVIAEGMKRRMGIVGLVIAMVIHGGFNYLVS